VNRKASLPADVVEAYVANSAEPLDLSENELDHFKGCVDRSGTTWKVPKPSPRFLRVIRRMVLVKGTTGPRICALVDVSQLPAAWAKPIGKLRNVIPILVHLRFLLQDALVRSGVKVASFRTTWSYFEFVIDSASAARAGDLVAAHAAFVGTTPAYSSKVSAKWKVYADTGMRTFAEADEAKPAPEAKASAKKKVAITRSRVVTAVKALREAGEATVKALRLPDPKDKKRPYKFIAPSAPASPEKVADAERRLKLELPASYKHFLSLHDGWKEVDLGSDLLGVEALVKFHTSRAKKVLPGILDEIGRKTIDGLLVLGTTKADKSMFIFDTTKLDRFGEWAVLEYDAEEGLLDEYDNFVAFLEDTAQTVRSLSGE